MRYAQCKKISREAAEDEVFLWAFTVQKHLLQGSLLLLNPRLEMGYMIDDMVQDTITFRLSGHAVKVSRIIKKMYVPRTTRRKNKPETVNLPV